MKVKVDPKLCIGCGLCTSVAEDVFEMDGMKAVVKKGVDLEKNTKQVKESVEACPVAAIKVS